MISIYCNRRSDGARALVNKIRELGGQAERSGLGGHPISPGTFVVNWGTSGPLGAALNRHLVSDKLAELKLLKQAGVRTPYFRIERPGPPPEWLPRTLHHQGGRDFRAEMGFGDFYTKRVECIAEYRIHVVKENVIRIGKKIPKAANCHPWIRSHDFGWKFSYNHDIGPISASDLAIKALQAVLYDFGAVDVGIDRMGEPLVFEVNSAPGIEGGTIKAYAGAFMRAEREARGN